MHAARVDTSSLLCASIGYVEATSALTRMRKGRKITVAQLRDGGTELDRLWRSVNVHTTNEGLIDLAASVAREDALRAYDAVHLAAAVSFAQGESLEFACWDRELRKAAQKRDLTIFPKSL
jgi:uncharacterized protein